MSTGVLLNNETYYEKMAAEGQKRLLAGEDKIWGVMPYDPTSEYQQVDTTYLEAWDDIPPELIQWFVSRIVASYDEKWHDLGEQRFGESIEEFKQQSGDQLREIIKEGGRLAVNVDHQSRFSPLIGSLLLQHAAAESREELIAMRSICSTIYSRYLGFYELKVGEILGDPENIPSRPALDIARNFCNLIPVFPNTDIRDSCDVDPEIQHDYNKKVMAAVKPEQGKAHIRTLVASAAIDKELGDGQIKMRTVGEGTKASLLSDEWDFTMAIATHIDHDDPTKSFFVASDIEEGVDQSTLDRQNQWIADERSFRTGTKVNYAANKQD